MCIKICTFILIIGCFLTGCSKENQYKKKTIVVNKSSGSCLTEVVVYFRKYVNGQLSVGEIDKFWGCAVQAISEYQRLTSGEGGKDSYRPESVMRFLEKHFIKNTHIDGPLLYSFMELKRVLFKGRVDEITGAELESLKRFLILTSDITKDLNPHVRVLFFKSESATDQQLEMAGVAVRRAFERLGQWLDQRRESYSFDQFELLISQLEELVAKKQRTQLLTQFRKGFDILPAIKAVAISGWRQGVDGHEWKQLLGSAGHVYAAFLSFNYAFKGDLNSSLMRGSLPLGILSITKVLQDGVRLHSAEVIPFSEWDQLFQALESTKWLPKNISAVAMGKTMRWITNRLLNGGVEVSGMSRMQVQKFEEQMTIWIKLSEQATSGISVPNRLSFKYEQMLKESAPLKWDSDGRMYFPEQGDTVWSQASRSRMVWPFIVLNWVKESFYGVDVDSLNADQMVAIAEEFLPIIKNFGWLTGTESKIGKKLLRESDLFTLSSNGNQLIEIHEATRYLAFVASAFRAAEIWIDSARAICGQTLAVECVRAHGAIESTLVPWPRLSKVLGTVGRDSVNNYMIAAEETILGNKIEGSYSTGKLLQTLMIFQYIETFVTRFDRNMSETIDLSESGTAYDLFGPTLVSLVTGIGFPEEDVLAFFTFLLKYGDTPMTMFGGNVKWLHWKWHQNDWQFESDRNRLMSILNQLSKL